MYQILGLFTVYYVHGNDGSADVDGGDEEKKSSVEISAGKSLNVLKSGKRSVVDGGVIDETDVES